jgi:hypothetical protein
MTILLTGVNDMVRMKVEIDVSPEDGKELDLGSPVILNSGTTHAVVVYPVPKEPEKPKFKISNFDDEEAFGDARFAGFCKILNLGTAVQATFKADRLVPFAKMVSHLNDLGFAKITLTLEKDGPLVIGTPLIGFGLAPKSEET